MVRAVLSCALALVAVGCRLDAGDPLAGFGGGFDPVRFDAGVLAPATLTRPLRFAVPPYYSDELAAGSAAALERYLEQSCGFDVELTASVAYDQRVVEQLRQGELDVAELSPYQYADAMRAKAPLVPLAATVARGSASYGSYLVVKAGSPLHTIDDLRGGKRLSLALVAPLSTSGYALPLFFLIDHGIAIGKDVELVLSGSHPASMNAALDGRVDVAAVSSDLLIGNVGLAGQFAVLAKVGRMPNDLVVARANLDPAALRLVERALLRLSIHDAEARAALRAFSPVDGFMPVPPGHYDEIAALAERTATMTPPPMRALESTPKDAGRPP
ncbi:MAG: PhnD/SsuA/transferrin family substrate-binding protein [Deltaproteobacteria bacterium]|nr:PhnD/SsuA/transferrin family substrate-binding protein [Deltaproteobacteria bacterium]